VNTIAAGFNTITGQILLCDKWPKRLSEKKTEPCSGIMGRPLPRGIFFC